MSGRRGRAARAAVTALGTVAVAGAGALLPAAAAQAGTPVAIHERWVDDISGTSLVCGGVELDYSGRIGTTIHVVEQPSGGFHVTIEWNSMGVSAVAPDGTVYRDITTFKETKTATDEWVADDGTGTFTESAMERIRVFAPGSGEALLTRDWQFTITKVDGELRVVRDSFTESCTA
jgi:hypothetical protein